MRLKSGTLIYIIEARLWRIEQNHSISYYYSVVALNTALVRNYCCCLFVFHFYYIVASMFGREGDFVYWCFQYHCWCIGLEIEISPSILHQLFFYPFATYVTYSYNSFDRDKLKWTIIRFFSSSLIYKNKRRHGFTPKRPQLL